MIVEQRSEQRRSRFRPTGDETRAVIEREHYFAVRDFRNQSTNRGSPSSNFVFGLYPRSLRALEMSAQVSGMSPGCSGSRLIFAFLPSAFSIAAINSFN